MRARAPASAANLGPGLDVLALALDRYVEVEVEEAESLVVGSEGEGAGLWDGPDHLAVRVAAGVVGHDRLRVTVRSDVPVARGLGSSAAIAAAAAAAAGAPDPLGVAARVDGHPDKAAAAVRGGLVAVTGAGGSWTVSSLPLDPDLSVVALVPDRTLPTALAREALPEQVSREDATFNLGRLALLLSGLSDHRALVREATEDRLHQPYRTTLFPEAPSLLSALVDGGSLAACWSGAGPTMLGICSRGRAGDVAEAARAAMAHASVPGDVVVLRPDLEGLVTGPGATLPDRRAPSNNGGGGGA